MTNTLPAVSLKQILLHTATFPKSFLVGTGQCETLEKWPAVQKQCV